MNKNYALLLVFAVIALAFVACEDEEDKDTQAPVISDLEIGHDDTLHAGEEAHIEFSVTDNEALASYTIQIHHGEDHMAILKHGDEWEFDSTFTEIAGLKNFEVHHHAIMVPEEVEEGEYHFHLTVADEAGNTATEERDVIVSHEEGDHDHDH
jgi:hypothetical protein